MATKPSLSEELTGKPDTQHSPKETKMANNNTPGTKEVADLDDFDLPDIIDPVEHETSSYTAPSLAELDATPLDHDQLAKDREDCFLTAGEYMWQGERKATLTFNAKDTKDGDISKKGRMFIVITGNVERKDGTSNGFFRAQMSPDRRNQKDFNTKKETNRPDGFYQNWLSAVELFFDVKETNPTSRQAVIEFLLENPYYMYVTRSKSGNFLKNFVKF